MVGPDAAGVRQGDGENAEGARTAGEQRGDSGGVRVAGRQYIAFCGRAGRVVGRQAQGGGLLLVRAAEVAFNARTQDRFVQLIDCRGDRRIGRPQRLQDFSRVEGIQV
jgi:hypothetical protein